MKLHAEPGWGWNGVRRGGNVRPCDFNSKSQPHEQVENLFQNLDFINLIYYFIFSNKAKRIS